MEPLFQRVVELLRTAAVPYEVIPHQTDYTAQQAAQDTHTSGHAFAKTVLIWVDGRYVLAVLPAPSLVNLELFRQVLGANHVALATESELRGQFPDCEVGALPPFGNLYNLSVYVDMHLHDDDQVTFNAGTHRDAIRMRYGDLLWLVKPTRATFATEKLVQI
ncbi:MAG: YbaK/EbsC family protein [Chloroflexaceae bacterium]|nr:YbaK/EbsC family protein [Chloroflexaceae bacterium]